MQGPSKSGAPCDFAGHKSVTLALWVFACSLDSQKAFLNFEVVSIDQRLEGLVAHGKKLRWKRLSPMPNWSTTIITQYFLRRTASTVFWFSCQIVMC